MVSLVAALVAIALLVGAVAFFWGRGDEQLPPPLPRYLTWPPALVLLLGGISSLIRGDYGAGIPWTITGASLAANEQIHDFFERRLHRSSGEGVRR